MYPLPWRRYSLTRERVTQWHLCIRHVVDVIDLIHCCLCSRGRWLGAQVTRHLDLCTCEQHKNAALTCREHARREDRPSRRPYEPSLAGTKTLLLEDALNLEVGFLGGVLSNARKNLSGVEKGGSLFQITKDPPPNHNIQPTTACKRPRG